MYGEIVSDAGNQPEYRPIFFRLHQKEDAEAFKAFMQKQPAISLYNRIDEQLKDLIKGRNPNKTLEATDYARLIKAHLAGEEIGNYGVWVYYPWSRRMVHLLDKAEFAEVRTLRNLYKITDDEQHVLGTKKIGIVGLSVGQSIALTLAIERICGELRLADFDRLELSNMNRIRTGVHNLGVPKVVLTAREIAEIDPFLEVKCFEEGLTADNMQAFFMEGGKLDLLVEECDGFDIKILSRLKARELGVPVVMDTNDRGMIDIEHFGLEPDRPILHGMINDLNPEQLSSLNSEEKVNVLLDIVGVSKASPRAVASLMEVKQSITTWPQLASAVVLGGAVVADVSRRILLGDLRSSGRYYVDVEELIPSDKIKEENLSSISKNPFKLLTKEDVSASISKLQYSHLPSPTSTDLLEEHVNAIVKAGSAAPSAGNDQPWKWHYRNGYLFLFHERARSFSFGNFKDISSNLTFGAVIENVVLSGSQLGLEAKYRMFPLGYDDPLVVIFSFSRALRAGGAEVPADSLSHFIEARHTNRNISAYWELDGSLLEELKRATEEIEGAELHWLTKKSDIEDAGRIIGSCDRIRVLNPQGHSDLMNRELRWEDDISESPPDGIHFSTLGFSPFRLKTLRAIKNPLVISHLSKVKGGKSIEEGTKELVASASAIGLVTVSGQLPHHYVEGGRAFQRMWLTAEKLGLAIYPLISPLFLFPRITLGSGEGLSEADIAELKELREAFKTLFGVPEGLAEVFLFRLSNAPRPHVVAPRIPVSEILI
jgi:molybdopterin/thiamine biosynthesis adenylyltransferase/nitroreductase